MDKEPRGSAGKTIPVITRREQIAGIRTRARRARQVTGTARLLLTGFTAGAVLAWLLMITVGVIHGSWWRAVPAMSYSTAFLITGLGFITGAILEAFLLLFRNWS